MPKRKPYLLVDGKRLYPDGEGSDLPDQKDLERLKVGDLVLLIFIGRRNGDVIGDPMWVELTALNKDRCVGRLDDDGTYVPMHEGDPINFELRHVMEIMKRAELMRWSAMKRDERDAAGSRSGPSAIKGRRTIRTPRPE
jgi:hypothetical protein